MDKNKDGMMTLEEFIIACQEVSSVLHLWFFHLFCNKNNFSP